MQYLLPLFTEAALLQPNPPPLELANPLTSIKQQGATGEQVCSWLWALVFQGDGGHYHRAPLTAGCPEHAGTVEFSGVTPEPKARPIRRGARPGPMPAPHHASLVAQSWHISGDRRMEKAGTRLPPVGLARTLRHPGDKCVLNAVACVQYAGGASALKIISSQSEPTASVCPVLRESLAASIK